MDDKELIWVSKGMAKRYQEIESDEKKLELVEKLINDRKSDIKDTIASLDDDLLLFKAFATRYKIEFEKVAKEQNEQMNTVFDNCTYVGDAIYVKVKEVTNKLKPISDEIKNINKCLADVSTYKLETMFTLVEKFSRMSSEEKEMFRLLLNTKTE